MSQTDTSESPRSSLHLEEDHVHTSSRTASSPHLSVSSSQAQQQSRRIKVTIRKTHFALDCFWINFDASTDLFPKAVSGFLVPTSDSITTFKHIALVLPQSAKSVVEKVQKAEKKGAKGVVITLSPQCQAEELVQSFSSVSLGIPVVAINNTEGIDLFEKVNPATTDEQHVNIEIAKDVLPYEQLPLFPACVPMSKASVSEDMSQGAKWNFHLRRQLKNLLHQDDSFVTVHRNPGILKEVFWLFEKFDIESSKRCSGLLKEAKQRIINGKIRRAVEVLRTSLEKNYWNDFPFYMLMAARLKEYDKLENVQKFTEVCASMFRHATVSHLSDTLLPFSNDPVPLSINQQDLSSTQLLYRFFRGQHCYWTDPRSGRKRLNRGSDEIGTAFVTTELYLFFLQKLKLKEEKERYFWTEKFVKVIDCSKLPWSSEVLNALECGFALFPQLRLEGKIQFSASDLYELIAAFKITNPEQIRKTVLCLYPNIHTYTCSWVVLSSKLCGWWRSFNSENVSSEDKRIVVAQGSGFLNAMCELFWAISSASESKFDLDGDSNDATLVTSEIKKWTCKILKELNVNSDDPSWADLICLFQKQIRIESVQKKVDDAVLLNLKENLAKVKAESFYVAAKKLYFLPETLVGEYLRTFHPSQTASILDDNGWLKLFSLISEREWTSLNNDVLTCIKKDAKSQKGLAYFLKLLNLSAPDQFPDLVSAPNDSFEEAVEKGHSLLKNLRSFLKDFLRPNALDLRSRVDQVFNCLKSSGCSHLRRVLLEVLREIVVPKRDELLQPNWTSAAKELAGCLKDELCRSDDRGLEIRNETAWSILAEICERLPMESIVVTDHPDLSHLAAAFPQKTFESGSSETALSDNASQAFCAKWLAEFVSKLWATLYKCRQGDMTINEINEYRKNYWGMFKLYKSFHCLEGLLPWNELEIKEKETEQIKIKLKDQLQCSRKMPRRTIDLLLLQKWQVEIDPNVSKLLKICIEERETVKIPFGLTGQFDYSLQLHFREAATCKDVYDLLQALLKWLEPLSIFQKMLGYFCDEKSVIFESFLGKHLNEIIINRLSFEMKESSLSAVSLFLRHLDDEDEENEEFSCSGNSLRLSEFAQVLERTNASLVRLLTNKAVYDDVSSMHHMEDAEKGKELDKVSNFDGYDEFRGGFNKQAVTAMLDLAQYPSLFESIDAVFRRYDMTNCADDPHYKRLAELGAKLTKDNGIGQMIASDCAVLKKEIDGLLRISKEKHCLFKAVLNSEEFFNFIKKRQFYGKGMDSFRRLFNLITDQLQGRDYYDTVLASLSVAFECVAPFTVPDVTFQDLVESLEPQELVPKASKVRNLSDPIKTVSENMREIEFWFFKAKEDILENVTDLKAILGGFFEISLGHSLPPDLEPCECRLVYSVDNSKKDEKPKTKRTINFKELNEFIRKLGFMDSEKESKQLAGSKDFHRKCVAVREIYDIALQLFSLGHHPFQRTYPVDSDTSAYDKVLDDWKRKLAEWSESIDSLRIAHCQILLFKMKSLFFIAKAIKDRNVSNTVQLVSCLFRSDSESVRILTTRVEKCFATPGFAIIGKLTGHNAVECVGQFLRNLTGEETLSRCLYPRRRNSIDAREKHIIYLAYGFSSAEVFKLILEIYHGFPEPYELLRCTKSTTNEELELFLQRAAKFPDRLFTAAFVNDLPFKLREEILKFQLVHQKRRSQATVNYILTKHVVFREAPWVKVTRCDKDNARQTEHEQFKEMFTKWVLKPNRIQKVQLVYGKAGDGKSHYIKKAIEMTAGGKCVIPCHEAFTSKLAISQLQQLDMSVQENSVYLNFTAPPPKIGCDPSSTSSYKSLMNEIHWFCFALFGLGYVEDCESGESFRLSGVCSWNVFIEVPALPESKENRHCLAAFRHRIPLFSYLGDPQEIKPDHPLDIDNNVQLVCKYLRAYKDRTINRLYNEYFGKEVKFSNDPDISPEVCHLLLEDCWTEQIKSRKILQRLFIKYMARRCRLLERTPGFYLNPGEGEMIHGKRTDTRRLGQFLVSTMLRDVIDLCDPEVCYDWHASSHQQLVYDFVDSSASFLLLSLHPNRLNEKEKKEMMNIGIPIPSFGQLNKRPLLDSYLSRALNVKLQEDGYLPGVNERKFILTIDYVIKMLNIHERKMCGIPVIIEGETGVGKTFLVDMLSDLWNISLEQNFNQEKAKLLELMQRRIPGVSSNEETRTMYKLNREEVDATLAVSGSLSVNGLPNDADLNIVCRYFDDIAEILLNCLRTNGVTLEEEWRPLITQVKDQNSRNAENTAKLMKAVLSSKLESSFLKVNVHEGLTPSDIKKHMHSKIQLAQRLLRQSREVGAEPEKEATVVIFFDEINTSPYMGLFKEILVDHSFEGEQLPSNLFIVGASNPHRGSSTAIRIESEREDWILGNYNVRPLPPTLEILRWNYGSLNEFQEKAYIDQKVVMLSEKPEWRAFSGNAVLTELVSVCQKLIREFAFEQLENKFPEEEAKLRASCCVSQRDIQRVFDLTSFFVTQYLPASFLSTQKKQDLDSGEVYDSEELLRNARKAMMIAIGVVYYFRLDTTYREKFCEKLAEAEGGYGKEPFLEIFESEIKSYIGKMRIPRGIAWTRALKENIFATIVCCVNRIPLIIVGAPGSSKTLSFNLTLTNLRGTESNRVFHSFPSLHPYYYQCSRRSVATDIETLFKGAITRQKSFEESNWPVKCVVFLDEAGLPESKPGSLNISHFYPDSLAAGLPKDNSGSLKVLHRYLDNPEVSFVASTNHILDAAKSNRAINLYRPNKDHRDLQTLAEGCMGSVKYTEDKLKLMSHLCRGYEELMDNNQYANIFGLRDFIHFFGYLRRHEQQKILNPRLILESLERNFNGIPSQDFNKVSSLFLRRIMPSKDADKLLKKQQRDVLSILKESLCEPVFGQTRLEDGSDYVDDGVEARVRYKMIIDTSEDDSLTSLLFKFNILDKRSTKILSCSDFPGDNEMHNVHLISALRHCASEGQAVILTQTENINESFYDLFNQRFRRIDDPKSGDRMYYANIAIGSHSVPCRVHPNFRCVVHMREADAREAPPPFLNRFEKFRLRQKDFLEAALRALPLCFQKVVEKAKDKVLEFEDTIKCQNFYGLKKCQTVDSVFLQLLPSSSSEHCWEGSPESDGDDIFYDSYEFPIADDLDDVALAVLSQLENGLCKFGFSFNEKSTEEEKRTQAKAVFSAARQQVNFTEKSELQLKKNPSLILNWLKLAADRIEFPDKDIPGSDEQCAFSIACLVQWMVFRVCSQLLQIAVPEAIILNRKRIPKNYLIQYLNHQIHFSLQKLLDRLRSDDAAGTKLICFTRTSPTLLSDVWPALYQEATSPLKETLANILADHPEVEMHKLEAMSSFDSFTSSLDLFLESEKSIFLLLANMEACSQRRVDLIRKKIEEREERKNYPKTQCYVFVLHFPPSMGNSHPCYSSGSLPGWEQIYLDTITQLGDETLVDICQWAQIAFLEERNVDKFKSEFQSAIKNLLPSTIPHALSRVVFGQSPLNGNFNRRMTASARVEMVQRIMKAHPRFGEIIINNFSSFWDKHFISEQVEAAALSLSESESTLSVGERLESRVKDLLHKFVAYTLCNLNKDYNLEILFDFGESKENHLVKNLFLDIFKVMPVPRIHEVFRRSHTFDARNPLRRFLPRFPFFSLVSKIIEEELETVIAEVRQNFRMESLGRTPRALQFRSRVTEELLNVLHNVTENKKEIEIAQLACSGIAEGGQEFFWHRYLNDFAHFKLHYDVYGGSENTDELNAFSKWIGNLENVPISARLVKIHVLYRFQKKEVGLAVSALRPLTVLRLLPLSTLPSLKGGFIPDSPEEKGNEDERLYKFCIGILYGELKTLLQKNFGPGHESLILWCEVYQELNISLPCLSTCCFTETNLRPKLQLMHGVFSAMKAVGFTVENTAVGTSLGNKIITGEQFSTENFQCTGDVSSFSLHEMVEVGLEALKEFYEICNDDALDNANVCRAAKAIASFMSDIFTFYFPSISRKQAVVCSLDDCKTMLHICNSQPLWRSVPNSESSALLQNEDRPALAECIKRSVSHPVGLIGFKTLQDCLYQMLKSSTASLDPRTQFSKHILLMIGEILVQKEGLESFERYTPLCYQLSSETKSVQQPLASLLFHCFLRHFATLYEKTGIEHVLHIASTVDQEIQRNANETKSSVLYIERQAIVQQIISKFVNWFLPEAGPTQNPRMVSALNQIFNDTERGGGEKGHTMTFLSHLIQRFGSTSAVVPLFNQCYHVNFSCFEWTNSIRLSMKMPLDAQVYQLAFIPKAITEGSFVADDPEVRMYSNLKLHVDDIVTATKNGGGCRREITRLHDYCRTEIGGQKEKVGHLRGMLWLCIFYEIFEQKISSNDFGIALEISFDCLELDDPQKKLFSCFADGQIWKRSKEEAVGDFGAGISNSLRPLCDLFSAENTPDIGLKQALAQLISVVLSVPSGATHLWTLLFNPKELEGTYLCGNVFNNVIEKSKLLESVSEFVDDGTCGDLHSNAYLAKSMLTLQSRYVLLWMNFGVFAVSLLTQRQSVEILGDLVFSDWKKAGKECAEKLKQTWKLLKSMFGFLDEERHFFVSSCLRKFLEVAKTDNSSLRSSVLRSSDSVLQYEAIFHQDVFRPVQVSFENKEALDQEIWLNYPLFTSFRQFHRVFPKEANCEELSRSLMEICKRTTEPRETEPYSVPLLQTFLLERQRFKIGGILLPDLMEFYNWLHEVLVHLLTKEEASHVSVGNVIDIKTLSKRYSNDSTTRAKEVNRLFDRIAEKYNKYVKFTHGKLRHVTQAKTVFPLSRETALLDLLSCEEEGKCTDALFAVIQEIIRSQNSFLDAAKNVRLGSWPVVGQRKISPQEVNHNNSFLGDVSFEERAQFMLDGWLPNENKTDSVNLIRRHHVYIPATEVSALFEIEPLRSLWLSDYTFKSDYMFDYSSLQQDIVKNYIAGLPLIDETVPIRKEFKFGASRLTKNDAEATQITGCIEEIIADRAQLKFELPLEFQETIEQNEKQRLEVNFHTLTYHRLTDVLRALRTVAGHLNQTVMIEAPESRGAACMQLRNLSVKTFLQQVYDIEKLGNTLTKQLGLEMLDEPLIKEILEIRLCYLYGVLDIFSQKLINEEYEFAHLPITLKTPLEESVEKDFLLSLSKFKDTIDSHEDKQDYTEMLKTFERELLHEERSMAQNPQLPAKKYLGSLKDFQNIEFFFGVLADDIRLEHYTHVRILIRRLINRHECQRLDDCSKKEKVWSELVLDMSEVLPFSFEHGEARERLATEGDSNTVKEPILLRRLWCQRLQSKDSSDEESDFVDAVEYHKSFVDEDLIQPEIKSDNGEMQCAALDPENSIPLVENVVLFKSSPIAIPIASRKQREIDPENVFQCPGFVDQHFRVDEADTSDSIQGKKTE